MEDRIYVVVRIAGGNIQDIDSSDPLVRVCVIDEDNIEAGDERPDEGDVAAYDYPVGGMPRPMSDEQKKGVKAHEHPADAE